MPGNTQENIDNIYDNFVNRVVERRLRAEQGAPLEERQHHAHHHHHHHHHHTHALCENCLMKAHLTFRRLTIIDYLLVMVALAVFFLVLKGSISLSPSVLGLILAVPILNVANVVCENIIIKNNQIKLSKALEKEYQAKINEIESQKKLVSKSKPFNPKPVEEKTEKKYSIQQLHSSVKNRYQDVSSEYKKLGIEIKKINLAPVIQALETMSIIFLKEDEYHLACQQLENLRTKLEGYAEVIKKYQNHQKKVPTQNFVQPVKEKINNNKIAQQKEQEQIRELERIEQKLKFIQKKAASSSFVPEKPITIPSAKPAKLSIFRYDSKWISLAVESLVGIKKWQNLQLTSSIETQLIHHSSLFYIARYMHALRMLAESNQVSSASFFQAENHKKNRDDLFHAIYSINETALQGYASDILTNGPKKIGELCQKDTRISLLSEEHKDQMKDMFQLDVTQLIHSSSMNLQSRIQTALERVEPKEEKVASYDYSSFIEIAKRSASGMKREAKVNLFNTIIQNILATRPLLQDQEKEKNKIFILPVLMILITEARELGIALLREKHIFSKRDKKFIGKCRMVRNAVAHEVRLPEVSAILTCLNVLDEQSLSVLELSTSSP